MIRGDKTNSFHVSVLAVTVWPHVELLNLVMDVALGKVFDVGELQVQLSQPHEHVLSGALKLLPLAGEILRETWRNYMDLYATKTTTVQTACP